MYTYSFANVSLVLDLGTPLGIIGIENFAAGSNGLITIAQKAPIATTTFGAWGKMTANLQRNQSADLQFTLLQGASENNSLEKWANSFQAVAIGKNSARQLLPITGAMQDHMQGDRVDLTNGIILSRPMQSRGQEIASVTWTITFEKAEFSRRSESGLNELRPGDPEVLAPQRTV